MSDLLFKVLNQGKSSHRGALVWSLPRDGQPGEWHEHAGELVVRQAGLHVTDDPARWWQPGCTVFVVEAEGLVGSCADFDDRKAVAQRVRLLREATASELAEYRIFREGQHTVKGGIAVALGEASVVARGWSRIDAWESSRVEAHESCRVVARGGAHVVARGWSWVEAWETAHVEAKESSSVVARGSSHVVASDMSLVEARDASHVEARGSSSVHARGRCRVEARDTSRVEVWGASLLEAREQVTVVSWCGTEDIKLFDRAVCIVRQYDRQTPPEAWTAQGRVGVSGTPPRASGKAKAKKNRTR